jgi:hypothetical protein
LTSSFDITQRTPTLYVVSLVCTVLDSPIGLMHVLEGVGFRGKLEKTIALTIRFLDPSLLAQLISTQPTLLKSHSFVEQFPNAITKRAIGEGTFSGIDTISEMLQIAGFDSVCKRTNSSEIQLSMIIMWIRCWASLCLTQAK